MSGRRARDERRAKKWETSPFCDDHEIGDRDVWVFSCLDDFPFPDRDFCATLHDIRSCKPSDGCQDASKCNWIHFCFTRGESKAKRDGERITLERITDMMDRERAPRDILANSDTTVLVVTMIAPREPEQCDMLNLPLAFAGAFAFLQRYLTASRIVSDFPVPPLTQERVNGPVYLLDLDSKGKLFTRGKMSVSSSPRGGLPVLSGDELEAINGWFIAGILGHPAELFRDLKLRAIYAHENGDCLSAVTMAGVACEVLMAQVAWMLYYEQTVVMGEAEDWKVPKKPSTQTWIDRLNKVLDGDTDWNKEAPPQISHWKKDVRDARNSIMHGGDRSLGSREAISAMRVFESFLISLLVENPHRYPHVFRAMAGPSVFKLLGKSAKYEILAESCSRSALDFIVGYREWEIEQGRG